MLSGAVKVCMQEGHLTAWPSKFSGTRKVRWQDGQVMVRFIKVLLAKESITALYENAPHLTRTGYFVVLCDPFRPAPSQPPAIGSHGIADFLQNHDVPHLQAEVDQPQYADHGDENNRPRPHRGSGAAGRLRLRRPGGADPARAG